MAVIYREVRRHARVGERIRIVNPFEFETYDKGDEFIVNKADPDGDVYVVHNGVTDYNVCLSEYAVLEMVDAVSDVPHPPEPSPQEARITAVADQVRDTLIRKNRDYGDSFSKQYAKYGIMSGLIRMDDKMARLSNLVGGADQQVADESVADTLMDLAGYAILTAVEMSKQRDLQ